jgi:GcrA cell cycle regulator
MSHHGSCVVPRWTAQGSKELARLWAAGLSGTKIAEALGGGVTRSAVIGRAYRMGLPQRGMRTALLAQVARRIKARRQRSTAMSVARDLAPTTRAIRALMASETPPDADLAGQKNLGLLDLEDRDCRWPTTAGTRHGFCGREKVPGLSYCRHHARLAFQAIVAADTTAQTDVQQLQPVLEVAA